MIYGNVNNAFFEQQAAVLELNKQFDGKLEFLDLNKP